jgi:hypothetical protein
MIDFPVPTFIGQTFNPGTGMIYTWDGVAWNLSPVQLKTARDTNLIVNPAMHISQQNGSSAGNTNGYWPVDQWQMVFTGAVCSAQQVASYTPDGSLARIRKTVTTPKASLAAADFSSISQNIEGSRISGLGFGAAAAFQSVLRFGFRGPAGTYSFVLRNGAGNRSYVKNFTILAAQANTDTVQAFVIPGDVTGTWTVDTTLGLGLIISDGVGSTYQGVEGWQAGNFLGTAANSNMVATNGNVVELFDVGLYADPDKTGVPPPFVAPLYRDALLDCMAYFQPFPRANISGYGSTGNYDGPSMALPVPMRVTPTVGQPTFSYVNMATGAVVALGNTSVLVRAIIGTTGNCSFDTSSNGTLSARM